MILCPSHDLLCSILLKACGSLLATKIAFCPCNRSSKHDPQPQCLNFQICVDTLQEINPDEPLYLASHHYKHVVQSGLPQSILKPANYRFSQMERHTLMPLDLLKEIVVTYHSLQLRMSKKVRVSRSS